MRRCNLKKAFAGLFLVAIGVGDTAIGAEIPFVENFSGAAPDFTFSSSSVNVTGVVGSDVLTIDSAVNTGGQSINALVNISNANGLPIVMSTDITPTAWVANGGSSAGFLAFSTNPAAGVFPSGANSGYLADITFPTSTNTGTIRILDFASGPPNAPTTIVQSTPFPAGSLTVNETYHLTFTATPGIGGVLDLSLTIKDTAGTLIDEDGVVTISGTTPAAASTGTFFGYRHRVGNNGSNRTFDAVYDNFAVLPKFAGDFDSDGDVDGADFIAWQTNHPLESGATPAQGDADGDLDVDGADFAAWQSNFPSSLGPGTSPVPEPGGVLLAGSAALAFIASAKRRRLFATASY
jgi:hypothetical protein